MFLQPHKARLAVDRLRWRHYCAAPTFLFADLVGFTAATERLGDAAAADLAREFRRTMCAMSCVRGARQIKSMGDGVMIWAGDPAVAISLASEIVQVVPSRVDLVPVRVGVHTGPAVRRGGDWYGSAVNIAARLAREAPPNQALVSAATQAAAGARHHPPLEGRRELALRGVGGDVTVWRLA
jgi:adenylate cyclase